MSEEIKLPDGYTKLRYLGNTGEQYIELSLSDLEITEGDTVEIETFQSFSEITEDSVQFEGGRVDPSPYFFFGINNKIWYAGCGSNSGEMIKAGLADTCWHTFKLKYTPGLTDGGFWIDGEKYLDCSGTYAFPNSISLFKADSFAGTDEEIKYYTKCYKKWWKLYVNDELKYDLRPCLDADGVPCMYDLVRGGTYHPSKEGDGKNFSYEKTYVENNENYELPTGYKKCLYLQSDGTQYIDTGIIPTNDKGLYIKAQRLNYGNYVPFGASSGKDTGTAIYPPRFNNNKLCYSWRSYKDVTSIIADKGDDYIYSSSINFQNERTIHFNSEDTNWDGYIGEENVLSDEGTRSIGLFSWNTTDGFLGENGKWGGRIYRAKISEGKNIIRDFVPAYDESEGKPCMYDLIGKGSYYNQGSGSDFEYCRDDHTLPSNFKKLKYLESTGTQYIKTGYFPKNTTGIYVDAYNTGKTTSSTSPMELKARGVQVSVEATSDMGNPTVSDGYSNFSAPRVLKEDLLCGYGWGGYYIIHGVGDARYEAYMNYNNDRKVIVKTPTFSERTAENLGELRSSDSDNPFKIDLCMFGTHNGYSSKYIGSSYRIYRLKITEEQEIVRDYIPAYDERLGKPCMYDLKNNKPYYNDGTGEFLFDGELSGSYEGFTELCRIGNRVGGHYDELPLGYIRANFLESTGTQRIDTRIKSTGDSVIEVDTVPVKYLWINTIFGDSQLNYLSDGTRIPRTYLSFNFNNAHEKSLAFAYGNQSWDGEYMAHYYADGTLLATAVTFGNRYKFRADKNNLFINGNQARKYKIGTPLYEEFESAYSLMLFGGRHQPNGYGYSIMRVYDFSLTNGVPVDEYGATKCHFIPCINDSGEPCMYDLITKTSFKNSNTTGSDFIVGLTEIQARDLYKLPETTDGGTLTISLPASIVDTDGITITDARVKSAKENAEEKGWTFTIQTYT